MAEGLMRPPRWAMAHDAFSALTGNPTNRAGQVMEQGLLAQKRRQAMEQQRRLDEMAEGVLQPQMGPGAAVYNQAAPQGVPHVGAQPGVNTTPGGTRGFMPTPTGENTPRSRMIAEMIRSGEIGSAYEAMQPQTPELPSGTFTPESMQRYMQSGNYADLQHHEDGNFKAVNLDINGESQWGREGPEGNLWIQSEDGWRRAPKGARKVGLNIQGDRESVLGSDKTAIRNFSKMEAKLPVLNRLYGRIEEGLSSGEFIGGVSGGALKTLNSLRSQVDQVWRNFNQGKKPDQRDARISLDRFMDNDTLRAVVDTNSKVGSALLDLVYFDLKMQKGEERVSDQDIRLALDTMGIDTNDPEVIMNRVRDKVGDIYASYRSRAQQMERDPVYQSPVNRTDGGRPSWAADMTEEEYQQLLRDAGVSE